MAKVVLMGNGPAGVKIAEILKSNNDIVERVYLHPESESSCGDEIIHASGVSRDNVFCASELKSESHVIELAALNCDFVVTVYWAYLLKPNVIAAFNDSVNFHPALLPINRGWFPHVHSILDGSPTGVTLHRIDEGADTGPIWAQKPTELLMQDTAKCIYDRLQKDIIALFKEIWPDVKAGVLQPKPQNSKGGVYHKKKEIDGLDEINLDAPTTARAVLNLLRARSFGEKGFAYIKDSDDEKVFMNLRLSKESDFR